MTTPEIRVDVLPVPIVGTVPSSGRNPYLTYLNRLKSPETKRTMQGCLDRLAIIMVPALKKAGHAHPGEIIPWHMARYEHATALSGVIAEKLALGAKGAEGGWSPAHANKHLTAWRQVMTEAKKLKLMTVAEWDEACDIAGIEVSGELAGRRIRNDEITTMLSTCAAEETPIGTRDGAVIALLWTTGGRRAEAAGARTERYDTAERSITIIGKGNKPRTVYVNPLAVPYIENWLALVGTRTGPLLRPVDKWGHVTARHLSTTAIGMIVAKRCEQSRLLPLTTHDYRRTFISNLLDRGADIATVQKIVGHASPVTTARYDRRTKRTQRAAVDLLNLDPEKEDS